MTQQRKDPEERKQEILDAAEKLFYEKDYTKTTINAVSYTHLTLPTN